MSPINALFILIIVGLVVGIVFYLIGLIPDAQIQKWVRLIAIVIVAFWAISYLLSFIPGGGYNLFPYPHGN